MSQQREKNRIGQVKDYLFSFLQLETLLSDRQIDEYQLHSARQVSF